MMMNMRECGSVQSAVLEEMTSMRKLQEVLGGGFEHFKSPDSIEKASFVVGSVKCGRMTLALCLIC